MKNLATEESSVIRKKLHRQTEESSVIEAEESSDNKDNTYKTNDSGFDKSNRKDNKFKKEDYDEIIKEYQTIKGITLQGNEFLPVQQAIKTMFVSKRTKEEIINCMKWFDEKSKSDDKNLVWTKNWTINTIKIKMPEFLAGKLGTGALEEKAFIPGYAKSWAK
jgi:hypothetical protein